MHKNRTSVRSYRILGSAAGIAGVVLLVASFAINAGPPANATSAELAKFGQEHYVNILWGAWMQAVGPGLIVFFALILVHLAGATHRLAGWMTLFGATVLMTVSLIEITFYISALHADPATMPFISLILISAVQHLYFMIAAPALFLPLGIVLLGASVLPRVFGYLAVVLALLFESLGMVFMLTLTLPPRVTAVAGIQALWWMAAAVTLLIQSGKSREGPDLAPVQC